MLIITFGFCILCFLFILFYAVLCIFYLYIINDNPLKRIFEDFRTKLHILY